jgi:hypothetical protein
VTESKIKAYKLTITVMTVPAGERAESHQDGHIEGDPANGLVCADVETALDMVCAREMARSYIEEVYGRGERVQSTGVRWLPDDRLTEMIRKPEGDESRCFDVLGG